MYVFSDENWRFAIKAVVNVEKNHRNVEVCFLRSSSMLPPVCSYKRTSQSRLKLTFGDGVFSWTIYFEHFSVVIVSSVIYLSFRH